MALVFIESETWRIWSDPDQGVQWMAAEVRRNDTWHAVIPECRPTGNQRPGQAEHAPLAAANFHMLPYSNRIRNGQFTFDGKAIQLDNAGAHAIHGALRKLPWQVESADDESLVCTFNSADHESVNWPWPITARIELRVAGGDLTSEITLTNNGDEAMPAGFGWHPYFVRHINESEPTLTLPVDGVFPDASGDCLPDGPAISLPTELDFRKPRILDADQRIDCCLSGLNGACLIDWVDAGIQLKMQASEQCEYLVLYNPDMPHFAIEPVTNANDAFNLATQQIDSGMQILAPGESLSASVSISAIIK